MSLLRPPSRALPVSLAALLLAAPAARAQDPAAPAAAGEPTVRVLGFHDRDPDRNCEPWVARIGDCVEEVDLLGPGDLAEGQGRADRALARAASRTSWWLWQDLAWRWSAGGSRVAQTLGEREGATLPTTAAQWDGLEWEAFRRPHVLGVPETAGWLTREALFPVLRRVEPPGVPAAPELVVLRGRFAERLGFDGRAWPYELMDADPATSGPFLEQLFPYRRSSLVTPLAEFDLPEHVAGLGPGDEAELALALGETRIAPEDEQLASFLALSHGAFTRFARTTGVQLAQFSLEDYTVNHVRILAALTAMRLPPGALQARTGLSRDLVAAALGETDATEALLSRVDAARLALPGGFPLRLEQLPPSVAWDRLLRLQAAEPAFEGADFVAEVDRSARAMLGELLRPDAPALQRLDAEGLSGWLAAAARPGADRQRIQDEVVRLSLARAMDALPTPRRQEIESWLLLDHVAFVIASGLDPDPAARQAPAEVAQQAEAGWRGVLSRHGRTARPMDQGLGAVDPTAICTTRDGQAALSERSFGAVRMDVVIDATDGLTSAEAVLWERRADLPLLAVDDPETARPELTRLVGLPEGRALYRVRWTLWTGWHLLWDVQPMATGQHRLAARTAALCEDAVLSPPELVPTLLRAGLLEGELLPTVPARRSDRPEPEPEPPAERSNDEALAAGQAGAASATGAATAGQEGVAAAREAPTPDTATALSGGLQPGVGRAASLDAGPVDAETAWLQALARAPLDALVGPEGTGVLLVLDATGVREDLPGPRARRTPYLRSAAPVGEGRALQVAGHMRYLDGPAGHDTPLLAPSWRPTESVQLPAELPRWRASSGLDFDLAAGLGLFPWRQVQARCATRPGDLSSVPTCPEEQLLTRSEGLSLDLGGGLSLWPGLRPRLGWELGLLALLDVVHSGEPLLWPAADGAPTGESGDGTPAYTWTLRPQGGLASGLRWQPRPDRLWGAGRRAPWGAEAADGRTRLARTEAWLRTGFTAGPGFNGLEGTLLAEAGLARSAVRRRGRMVSLAPYHPAFHVGGFVRYQLGFTLIEDTDETRLLSLDQSHTLVLGVRTRLRLHGPGPAPQDLAP